LPFLQQVLEHQDLIIADLGLRVDLGQFSVSHVGITFLRLRLICLYILVVVSKVFLKVHPLLKPVVTPPAYCHLIKVFKQGYESYKVDVFHQLLFYVVYRNLNILVTVPFEQPLLLLCQSFFSARRLMQLLARRASLTKKPSALGGAISRVLAVYCITRRAPIKGSGPAEWAGLLECQVAGLAET
jgi:hypothetical protein